MKFDDANANALWSTLDSVSSTLDRIDEVSASSIGSRLDELRLLLGYTRSFRESEELWLLSVEMVTQVQQAWANIDSYLSTHLQNPETDPAYIDAAISQLDVVRSGLARWPQPTKVSNAREALTRAIQNYRDSLDASRTAMEQRLDEVLTDAAARESAIVAKNEAVQQSLTDAQSALAALDQRITLDVGRLDTALTTTNDAFISSQTAREQAFTSWLRTQEADFQVLVDPYLEDLKKADDDASNFLEDIRVLRTSTVDMANLAAGDILAGQYETYARAERWGARIAYTLGAISAIAGVVVLFMAFGPISATLDWPAVVLKLGVSAAVGGVAAVAFRFAGQATKRSTSFKRQELELRALQPFLMGVIDADKAKTNFVDRAFGHAWSESVAGTSEPEMNEALLKLLTTAFQSMPRSGGAGSP